MSAVAVVLDSSALLVHAAGAVAVGEFVSEIADEEGRLVGVPAACVTAAGAAVGDEWGTPQLVRLISIDTVCVLPLGVDEALLVADHARPDGDIAMAHAVWAALEWQAYYITAQLKRVVSVLPAGWPVIDVSR